MKFKLFVAGLNPITSYKIAQKYFNISHPKQSARLEFNGKFYSVVGIEEFERVIKSQS